MMAPARISTVEWDKFYNIVDGQTRSSKTFHNGINPATGEKLWDVPVATEQDLNDAVAAAKKAFVSWSATPKSERDQKMQDFVELFTENQAEITKVLCAETGKPLFWGGGEVELTKGYFSYPSTIPMPDEVDERDDKIIKISYKPLGVVGAIMPWNFPLLLAAGKIGSCLAAGNTMIVKPSPYTPYATAKVLELAQQVFPPGVLSVLGGDDSLGPWMTSHPDIAKISFTGSTTTGKKIMAACAKSLKRVTLELGGNDVSIVLPDVEDVKAVARENAFGAFQTSGQVCIATKRIYVPSSLYQEFLDEMVRFTNTLKISSSDPSSVLGPVQNKMQYDRVQEFFADVKAKGYIAHESGKDLPSAGYFFKPTIIENPPDNSMIVREEPFGPIVPVLKYDDLEDVIRRANDSPNGLGGSVYGKDLKKAEEVADRLETGTVWINSFSAPSPDIFFPPRKESGMGGEWGKQGLKEMCALQVKHVWKKPPQLHSIIPPQQ